MNFVKKIIIVMLSKFYIICSFFKDLIVFKRYGIGNIHLLNAVQYGSSSIHLNITADEPVLQSNMKFENLPSLYNYTALLTGINLKKKYFFRYID